MSLATRCSACGTVFRVVQDQLKVSEGWVRCGRCDEVFNALEGLLDLGREPPSGTTQDQGPSPTHSAAPTDDPAFSEPSPVPGGEDTPALRDRDAPASGPDLHAVERPEPVRSDSHNATAQSTPAERVNERDRLEFPDAQFDSEPLADDRSADAVSEDFEGAAGAAAAPGPGDVVAAAPFWRRPGARGAERSVARRAALGTATAVLVLGLILQAAHHFRESIAARWPAANPVLTAWCDALHCSIGPLRHIEDVTVESTSLTKGSRPEALRLSVALRNRGELSLALPSVDLSLTDSNGQLVARRMLSAREFGTASPVIRPGQESALELELSVGGVSVSGYTVEIFYP